MVKVKKIKPPHKKVHHKECGAVLEYYDNEVMDGGVHYDYGGGSEQLYYIICPNCGNKVLVERY